MSNFGRPSFAFTVRFLLCCLLAAGSASGAPTKYATAVVTANVQTTGTESRLASVPSVASANDPFLRAQLEEVFAHLPAASDADQLSSLVTNKLKSRFKSITVTAGPAGPPRMWNVNATLLNETFQRLIIAVPTSALRSPEGENSPTMQPIDLGESPALQSAALILIGTNPNARPLGPASTALQTIRELAVELAHIVAKAYAESPSNYRSQVETQLKTAVEARGLTAPYYVRTLYQPSSSSLTGHYVPPVPGTLVVELDGLDPVSAASAFSHRVDLPNDKGEHLTFTQFYWRYGNTPFTRNLVAAASKFKHDKLEPAVAAKWPAESFPRFINNEEQDALAEELRHDYPSASEIEPVSSATGNRLQLKTTYLPSQATYSADLHGDSGRTLAGTASFKYREPWIVGDDLSANFSAGTDGINADAGYQFPFPIKNGPLARFRGQLHFEGSYALTRNVRLGTRHGPLVSREEGLAGPALKLTRTWPGETGDDHFTLESTLNLQLRTLHGYGPAPFLGPSASLSGLTFNERIALEYARDNWTLTGSIEVSRWLVSGQPDYDSGRASLSLRRVIASAKDRSGYVELRGGASELGTHAPRIDFARLGGDEWQRGMEDGELAGRSARTIALEGGPSLSTALSWLPKRKSTAPLNTAKPSENENAPSALDGMYLYGFIERSTIGGQTEAGIDYNGTHRALSYGLGARLRGAASIPGIPGGGSVAFGYAWSPQAIRPQGRFFVSAFFLFSP